MSELNSILLIGGSGFLGLHLIEQFHRRTPKTKIHVFDVRPLPKLSSYYTFNPDEITVHLGDIASQDDVSKAVIESNCDVVVHSASPLPELPAEIYDKVNVLGTKTVIEVCKNLKVKALVYTSSAGVIFNGNDVRNGDETWPYPEQHMDHYNETKAIAETSVIEANNKDSLLTVSLRPAGIFGPGDRQLVPGFRAAGRLGQSKYQLGSNDNICDWTYVGNIADAHVLAAQKLLNPATADEVAGEVFIITNDAPTYFWTLARTIWKQDGLIVESAITLSRPVSILAGYAAEFFCKLIGKEPGFTPFRARLACAHRYHDITKARTILGYNPEVDVETGIRYTLDWMDETNKQ